VGSKRGRARRSGGSHRSRRKSLEEAHAQAARAASRGSLLGAMGFGIALVMLVNIVAGGALPGVGSGVQMFLLVAGVLAGAMYTGIAVRASRAAKQYRRRLERASGR
jgi:hypothetical protein